MVIENFVDKAFYKEFDEVKNSSLEDLISYMHDMKIERLYITINLYPVYLLDNNEIIRIIFENYLSLPFKEYFEKLEDYNLINVFASQHIIETYNYLRKKRIYYAPVIKKNKIIGEISFYTLSLKISFLAIKDNITNVFNEKYFKVIIEEYNELNEEVGIIYVKVNNLSILESIYGSTFKFKILKKVAVIIKNSIRDVDFVFRNDDIFKILTFNNLEITTKIKNRLENKLKNLEIDDLEIKTSIVTSHVPEIETNILLAIENLENKLIKRD